MIVRSRQSRIGTTIEVRDLDTVLGLSMTPTTVGWVLVDGQDADGATLDREEFTVRRRRGGVRVVNTSAQAAQAVLRLQTTAEAHGQRFRGIGVTWSDDAAAEAALLLESLTGAGFDNVVPVRFLHAAELLARGIGPIVGSEHPALCVIEPGLATVVMAAGCGEGDPATAQRAVADREDLVGWLATLFGPGGWRPEVLVVAGSGTGLDALAARLEARLAIPVFAQSGAQLALARGAALASGPGAELSDAAPDEAAPDPEVRPARSQRLSYAGALTMLVAGVLTFVVSLSIALSLQLTPATDSLPAGQVAEAPAASAVAHAGASAVAPAPAEIPAPPADAPEPAMFGSVQGGPAVDDGPGLHG
jgi:hypothetical protein